jgi:DNA-binding MarR family transcriptional regulator
MSTSFDFNSFVDVQQLSKQQIARLRETTGQSITFTDLRALKIIAISRMTITAAAQALNVDLSRASRQIAHLEKQGLVDREADVTDGRTVQIELSDAGQRTLANWRGAIEADYLLAQSDWTEADLVKFNDLVAKFHDSVFSLARDEYGATSAYPAEWLWPTGPIHDDTRAALLLPTLRYVDWIPVMSGSRITHSRRAPIGNGLLRILGVISTHRSTAIGEIADRTSTTPSNTSRQIQQLEDHGLVARAVHPHDRRSHLIKVTPRGIALLRQSRTEGSARHAEAVADWDVADVETLVAGFDRLLDDLRVLRVPATGAFETWTGPSSKFTPLSR